MIFVYSVNLKILCNETPESTLHRKVAKSTEMNVLDTQDTNFTEH